MSKLKIKKLDENAVLPAIATSGSVGYDLTLVKIYKIDGNTIWLSTELAVEPPEGYHIELLPRSSISKVFLGTRYGKNIGLMMANSVGLVDQDYRGALIFAFKLLGDWNSLDNNSKDLILKEIEANLPWRIGQMVIRKTEIFSIEVVDDLSDTSRGSGGFGSTGN